jgi:ASC-1-like (ASCH) protein
MAIHALKTEQEYFRSVLDGRKKFELRKNDRDFKVFDTIQLKECINGTETGLASDEMQIKYILHGGKYGLKKGYCIICW